MLLKNYYTKVLEIELEPGFYFIGSIKKQERKFYEIGFILDRPMLEMTGRIRFKIELDFENENYNKPNYLKEKKEEFFRLTDKLDLKFIKGEYKEVVPNDKLLKRLELNTLLEIKEKLGRLEKVNAN